LQKNREYTLALAKAVNSPNLFANGVTFEDFKEMAKTELEAAGYDPEVPVTGALKIKLLEAQSSILEKQKAVQDTPVNFGEVIQKKSEASEADEQAAQKQFQENQTKLTGVVKPTVLQEMKKASEFKHGEKTYSLPYDEKQTSEFVDKAVEVILRQGYAPEKVTPDLVQGYVDTQMYIASGGRQGIIKEVISKLEADIKAAADKAVHNGQPVAKVSNPNPQAANGVNPKEILDKLLNQSNRVNYS